MSSGAPPSSAPPVDTKPAAPALNILTLIPEDLEVAAGGSLTAMSDSSNPYSETLLNQFRPVISMLEGAGVSTSDIEKIWCGTTRARGDVIVCVQTKAELNTGAITKALATTDAAEKVGSASIYAVTRNTEFNNSVGFVNSRTLVLGRKETVVAALNNPKAGSVRAGLDALGTDEPIFWISGIGDDSFKKLNIRGFESLNWFSAGAPKPRGMALCLAYASSEAAAGGQSPGGMGMPAMTGGSGGTPAPMGSMPGGPGGTPAPMGSAPGGSGGSPPPMGAGMPGMAGSGGPGKSAQAANSGPKRVEVRVAWNFPSEAAAGQMETVLKKFLSALNEAQKALSSLANNAGGSAPGGASMPPGAPGAGGMTPGMPGMAPGAPAGGAAPLGQGAPPGGAAPLGAGGARPGGLEEFPLELFPLLQQGRPPAGGDNRSMPPTGGRDNRSMPPTGGPDNRSMPPTGGPDNRSMPPTGGPDNRSMPPTGGPDNRSMPGSGGSAPGGMPSPGGMNPGMNMGNTGDDPNVVVYRIERSKEFLRLVYRVPADDQATVAKLIGRMTAASGMTAIDDGLYSGTLPALYKGIVDWQAAKPDPLLGAKVIDAKKQIIYSYSWMTELLPYVGYENLYSKLDMSQTWTASYNLPYAATVVPAFLNPADPRATWDGLGPALAATHFAGMSGVEDGRNVIAAMLPRTDPRA
ncbi:MAG: DUF1559 domain-containing protein, partial [Planctomycetes bacterium]|nr:DUF1559 domain-containing protein [Planctomycetota bacterium]